MTNRTDPSFGSISIAAVAALGCELFFGFGFFFAPGWANGWPGGLSMSRVWSAGMTAYLFAIILTIGLAVGGMFGLLLSRFKASRQRAAAVFWVWLACWAGLAALFCAWAYGEIYSSTLEAWRTGYPG